MVQPLLFRSSQELNTYIERDRDSLNIPEGLDTVQFSHGLHRFPGKFIPQIPRYIFQSLLREQQQTVFDPFCGSGTTLVEAAIDGRHFVGLDIDPLSTLISRVKVTPLTESELSDVASFWRHHRFESKVDTALPAVPNLYHWFSEAAATELSSIRHRIESLPDRLRWFSCVVFSSIIRRVSNADDQTQKTYVSHTFPKTPPLPSQLFPVFLRRAIDSMREFRRHLPSPPVGVVMLGDARTQTSPIAFHDVVTSPPYIDSIDYIYNQMLEYFWLLPELGLSNYDDLRRYRKLPMGFNVSPSVSPDVQSNSETLDSVCAVIERASKKEAVVVRNYFIDFAAHISLIRKHQPVGGRYVCIVGNSTVRKVVVPTADLLSAIFQSRGYRLVDKMRYEIRRHYMKFPRKSNSGKIREDHVLVFVKQ